MSTQQTDGREVTVTAPPARETSRPVAVPVVAAAERQPEDHLIRGYN